MKVWKYIYIDNMVEEPFEGPDGPTTFRHPEHDNLFTNCPISYDIANAKCYIHSDEVIDGLTLFSENTEQKPSIMEAE